MIDKKEIKKALDALEPIGNLRGVDNVIKFLGLISVVEDGYQNIYADDGKINLADIPDFLALAMKYSTIIDGVMAVKELPNELWFDELTEDEKEQIAKVVLDLGLPFDMNAIGKLADGLLKIKDGLKDLGVF